jgi:hypothetical protein
MAMNAASLPAGIDTTLYDLGRMAALWVSAFEILAHPPKKGKSGLHTVYPLFERVAYLNPRLSRKKSSAYMNRAKPWPRRPLACWLYGKLYKARCDFLHGNPVSAKTLNPSALNTSIFWFAPSLYRLALTGFINLKVKASDESYINYRQYQSTIDRHCRGLASKLLRRLKPRLQQHLHQIREICPRVASLIKMPSEANTRVVRAKSRFPRLGYWKG